jgi:hypothetical protein
VNIRYLLCEDKKEYILCGDERKKDYILREDKENKTSDDLYICQSVIVMPDDQVYYNDASCYPVDVVTQLMMLSSGCCYPVDDDIQWPVKR